MKKIAVIGAGVAGLSAAARLAHNGYDVTIFEKNDIVGGRMHRIELGDFKFDLGPTIVMMPEIYQEVFSDCDVDPDDYLDLRQLNTLYDLYFSDEKISFPSDLAQIHQLLERIEPGSAKGFFAYLSEIYNRYIIAKDHFITKDFSSPSSFYNPATLYKALQLKTFDSADRLIGKYIKNDKIKKMLAFQTLYIGISPYQGPSLYSMIPMIEMVYGVWYLKGGMYSMAKAMERLCLEKGVTIKTNAAIESIIIKDNDAKGVVLDNQELLFDSVLSTADFPYVMNNLIKDESAKKKYLPKKIESMDYSCSAYLMYLGVNRNLKDKMEVHNVIFADDFDKNIENIFDGTISNDFSMYVYLPSLIDDTMAPKDQESMYVLVPSTELKTLDIDWNDPEFANKFRRLVLDRLNKVEGLKDIENDIVVEEVINPNKLKDKFNAHYGAAFGLKPTLSQSNYFRPQTTLKSCSNLYFAGASNHPGAGVPIVLTGGKIAAQVIMKNDKSKI